MCDLSFELFSKREQRWNIKIRMISVESRKQSIREKQPLSSTPLQDQEGPLASIQVVPPGGVPRFKCLGIPNWIQVR